MENTYYVYVYRDPVTKIARYVGKGKGNRYRQHAYNIKTNQQLNEMLKRRSAEGHAITPEIFHCCDEQEAFNLEIDLIAKFGRLDKDTGTLFNHTDGGDGRSGFVVSEKTKKKISESLTGEKHPAYGKRGVQCPNYGRKQSMEQRSATSRRLAGKKQDPELVAKRAKSNTGKRRTPEQLENLRRGQARYRARQASGAGA